VKKEVKGLLLLDAGDLLFRDAGYGDNPDVALALEGKKIIESHNAMGWTALGIGERELALGLDYLKDLEKMADFPFLSANIFDKETNKYVFEPYVVVKIGGFRVGITSVLGTNVDFPAARQDALGVYVADPTMSLSAVVKELHTKSDFVIVLSHTGVADAKILAQKIDGIDLMIVGHSEDSNLYEPITVDNTLITDVFARGKYIDRLDFDITKPTRPYDFLVEGTGGTSSYEHQQLIMRKQQLMVFLADIEAEKKKGKDVSMMEKVVNEEMAQVEEKLEKLEAESTGTHANTVKPMLIALDAGQADDPVVREIIKKYADELIKIKEQERKSMLDGAGRTRVDLAAEPHYVGMESCKECHAKIYEFVKGTAHTGAYETLRKNERQFEPACISCHTTGYRKPGGFTNVLTATNLLGVQCETCHGPGSLHVTDDKKYKMEFLVASADCVTCHNPDNDDNFVWDEKLKKIKCPAQ
jgi:hypothetical protein